MFGLGWPEVVIIALVAVVVFGPKKIPEVGGSLGRALRGFKEGFQEGNEATDPDEDPS
jgi:sec-independent protein translocase protein TatA